MVDAQTHDNAAGDDGVDRSGKRQVAWAIWIGVILGVVHGILLYGVFSIPAVAMAGLMVILVLGLFSAWVGFRRPKPTES